MAMCRLNHVTMTVVVMMTAAVLCSPLTGNGDDLRLPHASKVNENEAGGDSDSFYNQQHQKQRHLDDEDNGDDVGDWMESVDTDNIRLGAIRLLKMLAENRNTIAKVKNTLAEIDHHFRNIESETSPDRDKSLKFATEILDNLDHQLMKQQKRSCTVNLGGHCATENAASVANQWHYLNSAISPGRKRRSLRND